nr:hypothetical protein TetV2_00497 [Oceanusvirus sp.]
MQTGAGIRNALIALVLVVIAHAAILTEGFSSIPAAVPAPEEPIVYGSGSSLGAMATTERRRARRYSTPLKELQRDKAAYDWPPAPDEVQNQIPIGAVEAPLQSPYTRDADERAALHRLVFSEEEPEDVFSQIKPRRKMSDHSRPALSAEGGTTTGLFRIRNDDSPGGALNDDIAGIEEWGAGFLSL